MSINQTFNCFLHLHTTPERNSPVYGIEAVFCDDRYNIVSTYTSPLNIYEQKYLKYIVDIEKAHQHHIEFEQSINNVFNVIVTINDIDESLRKNKENETGVISTTIFWTDTRLNHIDKYNDLIVRICDDRYLNPYEFYINPFLNRCYYTQYEHLQKSLC